MSSHTPAKHFSTTARVHPSYLPYLHGSRGVKGAKWIPPTVALIAVGYGVSTYTQSQLERQHIGDMAAVAEETQRRQAAALLDDAYGDRSSLEGLERAMRLYEAQQQRQPQQRQ